MSKSEAVKQATRGLKPVNGNEEANRPLIADRPITEGQTGRDGQVLGEPVKRTRKPRDPNAPPREARVKPTLEGELQKLHAKYDPEVNKLREELRALDVKRAEVASRLHGTESRLARIVAVMSEPDVKEPATDPTYGDNKPENDGEKLPPAPESDPRFIPPSPDQLPPSEPRIDPNNQ